MVFCKYTHPATFTVLANRRMHVLFDEPQFAVTPGQAVVCYDAEDNTRVLGGGWIESSQGVARS